MQRREGVVQRREGVVQRREGVGGFAITWMRDSAIPCDIINDSTQPYDNPPSPFPSPHLLPRLLSSSLPFLLNPLSSHFTAKPAEDSPTQSPEEASAFDNFRCARSVRESVCVCVLCVRENVHVRVLCVSCFRYAKRA